MTIKSIAWYEKWTVEYVEALERLARAAIAREDAQRAYDRTPPVISADAKEEWLRLYWARNDGNREYNAALEEVRKWV